LNEELKNGMRQVTRESRHSDLEGFRENIGMSIENMNGFQDAVFPIKNPSWQD
jgi:hypothetical protein